MKRPHLLPSLLGLVALGWASVPVAVAPAGAAVPSGSSGSSGALATVDTGLPAGWSLDPAALTLVWSGSDVPMGGARPEFRLGADRLGFPREADGSLRLALTRDHVAAVLAAPTTLSVWSAGRRLDGPAVDRDAVVPAAVPPLSPTPAVSTDPAAPGRYATQRYSYDLAPLPMAEYPAPVEVRAEVTMPVGAPGRRPLVVILHGRHVTCFRGGPDGEVTGEWPCRDGWAPVPSHLGYRYLTDVLASQGYIAVSISANGINGQDWASSDGGAAARSLLIRHHLDLWARWSKFAEDPWGGIVRGHVDLGNVVLVGHSRGGEGVNRAAIDAPDRAPYRIRGLVTYGPTAFGRQVTPDITSAVLLPACDGDVADLQGQAYVDASRDIATSPALRSAVLALGADHNFFNTEWTPGLAQAPAVDDWWDPSDPVCGSSGPLRLTPQEQQQVGATYTMALVRLAVNGEAAMLPLLDGSKVKPAAIGRAEVSTSPVGGDSLLLYRPEDAGSPSLAFGMTGMTGGECLGFLPEGTPPGPVPCGDGNSVDRTPHWQPMYAVSTRPAPMALGLRWTAAPAPLPGRPARPQPTARFTVGTGARGVDLSRFATLDLRVANDPALAPSALAVRVVDVHGHVAVLSADLAAVDGWPGSGGLDRIEARTLRARLVRTPGVDLRYIVAVELVGAGSGHVWVLDMRATRQVVTSPTDLNLPRVSVDIVTAPEGAANHVTTVQVPIRVEGAVRKNATVWVQVRGTDAAGHDVFAGYPITIKRGAKGVVATVPLSFPGDDVYEPTVPGEGSQTNAGQVALSAVSGAVTAQYLGGVSTVEDDPAPLLFADPAAVAGVEGDSLLWTLRLSGLSAGQFYNFTAEPPAGGATELDSDDVDQDWLQQQVAGMGLNLSLPIDPPMPLSQIGRAETGHGLRLSTSFGFLVTEATIEIPLRVDRQAEGDEQMALDVLPEYADPTIPPGGLELAGSVVAHSATDGLPAWAIADAVAIDGVFGDSSAEEAAIDAIVGSAHVVLAGSMSRGSAPGESARTGLVADLVERHGVTDVLIDEPVATSVAAARYVAFGTGTADEAAAAFTDDLDRTVEAMAFLEALRAYNATALEPVFLVGIGAGADPSALVDVVATWDPVAAASLACFDLGPEGVATWSSLPDGDRATCRAALVTVRDDLAALAAVASRDAAGLDLVLAHAAAVALVAAEWSASVDGAAPGGADERASRAAEGLADGVLAARTREPAGRVVAALDGLDTAVLREVDEPVAVLGALDGSTEPSLVTVHVRASAAALLVDALGAAEVARIGVSVGFGDIRAYSVWSSRFLERQSLDRPAKGTAERLFSTFGPDGAAFVLPLAGQSELDAALPLRIAIRDEYMPWKVDAWYLPVSLTAAFDGIVHVRKSTATALLSQRPRLSIDGTPVVLGVPCVAPVDGSVVVTFANGELRFLVRWNEPTQSFLAATTVLLDGVTYTGDVPVSDQSGGWGFAGTVSAAGGASVTVEGFAPFDLQPCASVVPQPV